jgi:hypothetical protein
MVTIGILSQTHAMFTVFLAACLMLVGVEPETAPTEPVPSTSAEAPSDPAPSEAAPAAPAPTAPAAVTKPALTGAASGDPFEGAVEVFHFGFEEEEDRDFDRHPDGWIRRKGPDFPSYIEGAIDRERGHGAKGSSLCFKANGGRITMYSKPIVVDPYHSYVFRGYVRTQMLDNDAALVSISLLNHKRQRVQRYLTKPVTGTYKDWCLVTIGPIVPHDDVHFVAVGCHLVPRNRSDIRGAAWFDDLWMGELPLFSLDSNFQSHFREHDSPVVISSHVDGLDPRRAYRLDIAVTDAERKQVAATAFDLSRRPAQPEPPRSGQPAPPQTVAAVDLRAKKEKPIDWTLGAQPHGFYAVEAVLSQDGRPILTKRTSFAVMDTLSDMVDQGEFGWTIRRASDMPALKELAELASQAGINWLKYPLWNSVSDGSSTTGTIGTSPGATPTPAQISAFFEELSLKHITAVGLLNEPPAELRSQFARDWTGISELFTMRTEFWRESIEKVIARYSSHVRYWQLGEEGDESFVGMSAQNLSQTIARVKNEFDRIGRDTRIGVHWNWETPPPRRGDVRGIFLSIGTRQQLKENELGSKLKALAAAGSPERWVLVKPLPKSGFTADERGSDLVKKMVEAKIGGAEKIFIDDVFDEDCGLLAPGGSPSPLFLPWRTTAMALQGAEFIGSFNLPEGSRNFAFSRKGDVAIVVWNHEPVDEDLYLSEESIVTDVLGRRIHLTTNANGSRQKLRVGPSPLVIRHFPEQIARWMAAVSFEKGRLPSKTGKQREIIHGINTFHQGVNGQVRIIVPKDWKVEPPEARFSLAAGEKYDIPITLELPSNTSLGSQRIVLDFAMSPYAFRVYREYEVGLGDVVFSVVDSKLENGDLQIKQLIVNNTKPEERLNFECNLYIPNRKRMQRIVTKLGNGRDTQVYTLPDAESLRGQELQLRAQQIGGSRILNLRWKVGENWETAGKRTTADRTPPTRRAHRPEPRTLPSEPPKS